MAVNPLSLAESLRPWRSAGVTHFLREVLGEDGETAVEQRTGEDTHQCLAPQAPARRPGNPGCKVPGPDAPMECGGDAGRPVHGQRPGEAPCIGKNAPFNSDGERDPIHVPRSPHPDSPRDPALPASQTGLRDDSVRSGTGHKHEHDPRGRNIPPGETQAPAAPDSRTWPHVRPETQTEASPQASPGTWPQAWQNLLSRTKPAPILWTYPELGLDLGGQGSKERSACLRDMIGRLQLPKGSNTFWPLSLPHGSGSGPDAACAGLFEAGLQTLRPKAVILLGSGSIALAGLGLTLHTPFTQEIARGALFVLLPDFASFLANNNLLETSCLYLRTALAGIPALSSGSRSRG